MSIKGVSCGARYQKNKIFTYLFWGGMMVSLMYGVGASSAPRGHHQRNLMDDFNRAAAEDALPPWDDPSFMFENTASDHSPVDTSEDDDTDEGETKSMISRDVITGNTYPVGLDSITLVNPNQTEYTTFLNVLKTNVLGEIRIVIIRKPLNLSQNFGLFQPPFNHMNQLADKIKLIKDPVTLRAFSIEGLNLQDVMATKAFQRLKGHLPYMEIFECTDCILAQHSFLAILDCLKTMPRLKRLVWNECGLTGQGLDSVRDALDAWPFLECLILEKNNFTPQSIKNFLTKLNEKKITTLNQISFGNKNNKRFQQMIQNLLSINRGQRKRLLETPEDDNPEDGAAQRKYKYDGDGMVCHETLEHAGEKD